MKKILLIIAIAFCIFQLVVLAIAINIGSPAINRGSYTSSGYTLVDKAVPADGSGTITSVEIYVAGAMLNAEVATFYIVSGNNLSTRDNETIGSIAEGYSQHEVDLEVEEGDYIGIFYTDGYIDRDNFGIGNWFFGTDKIPCINQPFGVDTDRTISLRGTGETVGWTGPFNAVTVGKWNNIEITKWNDLE